jgi:hypothetical protein
MGAEIGLVRRVTDQSDRSVTYEVMGWDAAHAANPDGIEPWNEEPEFDAETP